MSQDGIGAMLHVLGGGSKNNPEKYYGREVVSAAIVEVEGRYRSMGENKGETLLLKFADGTHCKLWDDGQSCCEARYMTTDDKLSDLVGGKLRLIEGKKYEEKDGDYETHEMMFVEIATDKASVTIVNHNEHNGYYGGFGLTLTED